MPSLTAQVTAALQCDVGEETVVWLQPNRTRQGVRDTSNPRHSEWFFTTNRRPDDPQLFEDDAASLSRVLLSLSAHGTRGDEERNLCQ